MDSLYQQLMMKREFSIGKMKFSLAYTLCLLIGLIGGTAEAADEEKNFNLANKAYVSQDYEKAIELYNALLEDGKSSAMVYYNLGNAHYKLGHVAPTVLNYERALRLDPGFEDAQHNLKMANLKVIDNIDPLPELMFVAWGKGIFNGFSSRQWAIVSVSLFWLSILAAASFLFINLSSVKRISFFGGIILFVLGLVSIGLSFARKQSEENTQFGIISQSTAYIKNAPNGDQDLLILHEGAKVEILEISGTWNKVHIKGVGIDVVGFVKGAEITGI